MFYPYSLLFRVHANVNGTHIVQKEINIDVLIFLHFSRITFNLSNFERLTIVHQQFRENNLNNV